MRAILDGVVCKERTDLDPGFTTIPNFVLPEISRQTSPSMRPDIICYGEVTSIGPGSINCPRIKGVKVGDVVLYDLANVDHAYYDSETETGYQKLSQKALCAVMVEGEPRAIGDWVITERDDVAMKNFIGHGIDVPDEVLMNGQRTDELQDGSMRLIVERVVSAGSGRRYSIRLLPRGDGQRLAYDDIRAPDRWVERESVPQCVAGDLLGFSPSASTKFRRGGRSFRVTPWDEMQFMPGVE
jgi:hypothetical protein